MQKILCFTPKCENLYAREDAKQNYYFERPYEKTPAAPDCNFCIAQFIAVDLPHWSMLTITDDNYDSKIYFPKDFNIKA